MNRNLYISVIVFAMLLCACGTDTTSYAEEGRIAAMEFVELYNQKGVTTMQLQGVLLRVRTKEKKMRDEGKRAAANAYIAAFTETVAKEDSTAYNEITQP